MARIIANVNTPLILLIGLYALFNHAYAETAKVLSQPIEFPNKNNVKSADFDALVDRIFRRRNNYCFPTAERLSTFYADLLYRPETLVGRANYPEENNELRTIAAKMFYRWSEQTYPLKGARLKNEKGWSGVEGCITPATSALPHTVGSVVRLFDKLLSFPCMYQQAASVIDPNQLQYFFRELEHTNTLSIHDAQQALLGEVGEDELSAPVVTFRDTHNELRDGQEIRVDRLHVTIQRSWFEESTFSLINDNSFSLLRNELLFNAKQDRPASYCYFREVELLCQIHDTAMTCKIDSADCQAISGSFFPDIQ